MSEQSQKLKVSGLWKQRSQSGLEYLSGSCGPLKILVFPNDRKEGAQQPDYVMYVCQQNERREEQGETSTPAPARAKPAQRPASDPGWLHGE